MQLNRSNIIRCLPAPDYKENIEVVSGFNSDIIQVIHSNVPRAVRQSRSIASYFKGDSDLQTARNIWNFLKNEIRYRRDPEGRQDIRLPARFVSSGTGDCKSFSLFTASILQNLNIPYKFRYASYSSIDPTPQHVYIVTDSGIIIDGVWNAFNAEKQYAHKKDYSMKISTLSGIGYTNCRPVAGSPVMIGDIGKISLKKAVKNVASKVQSAAKKTAVVKTAAKVQTAAKNTKVVKTAAKLQSQVKQGGVKSVGLTAPRRAYRTLVAVNFRGWANKLNANRAEAKRIWEKAGGSFSELEKSINAGIKRKALFGSKNQQIRTVNGIGDPVTLTTIAAVIATATPLIAMFFKMTGDKGDTQTVPGEENTSDSGSIVDQIVDTAKNLANLVTGKTDTAAPQTQTSSASETPSETPSSGSKTGLWLLAAAAGAYIIFN